MRDRVARFGRTAPAWQRWMLALLVCAPLAYLVLGAAFLGFVLTTGCFFTCEDPQPEYGLPILGIGVAAVGTIGWVLTWAAGRPDRASQGAWVAVGIALVGTATLLVFGI
ncbi:MAG: hypothetical protein ACLGIR_13600 [Actinomycetes bacterium]